MNDRLAVCAINTRGLHSHPLSGAAYSKRLHRTTATLRFPAADAIELNNAYRRNNLCGVFKIDLVGFISLQPMPTNTHTSYFTADVRKFGKFEPHRPLVFVCWL